ncbi:MAG TPA: hypothetical protein VFP50_09705 [Anaeromyxobacteraceae bacterium]|nr:hypothetical protein [Anaeromyxobacteraceae bacterium]
MTAHRASNRSTAALAPHLRVRRGLVAGLVDGSLLVLLWALLWSAFLVGVTSAQPPRQAQTHERSQGIDPGPRS